jgi:hypothetical protein
MKQNHPTIVLGRKSFENLAYEKLFRWSDKFVIGQILVLNRNGEEPC